MCIRESGQTSLLCYREPITPWYSNPWLNASEQTQISVSVLILSRAGVFITPELIKTVKICQLHGDHFGIYWKSSSVKCKRPIHGDTKRMDDGGNMLLLANMYSKQPATDLVKQMWINKCSVLNSNLLSHTNKGLKKDKKHWDFLQMLTNICIKYFLTNLIDLLKLLALVMS